MRVQKRGYIPEIKKIVVADGQATNANFILRPIGEKTDASNTQLEEVKEDDKNKKPVPVSLIIGLTIVCLISLMLALALAIMIAKKYRGDGNVSCQYSAVHADP